MTLIRRPIDRTAMPVRSAMERFLSDWPFVGGEFTELAPPMDVRETDDDYMVEVELPGIDPNDVEVMIEGRTLTIRGTFSSEAQEHAGNVLLRERRRGQFMRAVALPGMVDIDNAESRYDNGLLTITLPKAAQNRPRRVQIGAGARGTTEARQGTTTPAGGSSMGTGGGTSPGGG
jgi:HSP20 family protein